MNTPNIISSLNLEKNQTALTISIPNEDLESFMEYLRKFAELGFDMKTCDFHKVTDPRLMFTPASGIPEMDKIKTIKKMRDCMTHLPTYIQGLKVMKDFVEKNGSLKLDERAIKNFKEAGIEVNWIE